MDVPGKRCFFSICEHKHCMRNSVRRDIFIPGLEANPWIEVLNETNQNGFYSQIPVRRSAQTELRSFRSRPSIGKAAACSQHVSGQRRELLPGEDICRPQFSLTSSSQPSPLRSPGRNPAFIELHGYFNSDLTQAGILPRIFSWTPQNNSTNLPGSDRAHGQSCELGTGEPGALGGNATENEDLLCVHNLQLLWAELSWNLAATL